MLPSPVVLPPHREKPVSEVAFPSPGTNSSQTVTEISGKGVFQVTSSGQSCWVSDVLEGFPKVSIALLQQ